LFIKSLSHLIAQAFQEINFSFHSNKKQYDRRDNFLLIMNQTTFRKIHYHNKSVSAIVISLNIFIPIFQTIRKPVNAILVNSHIFTGIIFYKPTSPVSLSKIHV